MNTAQTDHRGRKGFTLAELIMAIALLAFFSTLIVQVFAQAQSLTKKAETLDLAVNCASDLADRWKSPGSTELPEITDLQQNRQDGRTATIFLDRSMQPGPAEEAAWQAYLLLQAGNEADFWLLTIEIKSLSVDTVEPLFTLQTGHHWDSGTGAP